jgi:hypothetical protein
MALAALVLCGTRATADAEPDALREALALARASAYHDAVTALPDTRTLGRADLPLLGPLAAALRDEQPDAARGLLAAMRRLEPEAIPPRVALESLWAERPTPPTLNRTDLPFFPVDFESLSLPASEGLAAAEIVTVAPKAFLAVPGRTDARRGGVYPRVLGVYAARGESLSLRFTVHFVDAATEVRARQAGRWLGAVSLLSDHMLGAAGRARYPVSVWLSPDGAPGAEQWDGSILVRGVRADRSNLEWARQLTHEWGHAAIPGGGGFLAPEAWANGDLGERLFLPAMQKAGWLRAWDAALDVSAYVRRYVDPPRAAFARTGPVPGRVGARDATAFDHYLGACLYIAAAYGTPALAAAMDDMEGPRTPDLLAAFQRGLGARKEWTVARIPGAVGPAAVCFPVRGRYTLESGADGRAGPHPGGPARFDAGWTVLGWDGVLTVRRMTDAGKG